MRDPRTTESGGYNHDALLFDTDDRLIEVAVPFLLEGLAAGEAAVVATGRAPPTSCATPSTATRWCTC